MPEPIIQTAAMEEELRRCAVAMLPAAANAVWHRDAEPETANALGDAVGEATEQDWAVRVFFLNYHLSKSKLTEAGAQVKGKQFFIVASDADGWAPQEGDELEFQGDRWRLQNWLRQPVDDAEYFECVGTRIL